MLRLFSLRAMVETVLLLLVLPLLLCSYVTPPVSAFAPPSFGIGGLLFPVQSQTARMTESPNKRLDLQDVSDFFVESFWTAKVGGGARELSDRQRRQLYSQQNAEFNKRYGGRKLAEMIMLRNKKKDETIIACVGVEVDRIPEGSLKGPVMNNKQAPLMSNLAVSREYRRRGLAEQLVAAVETMVRKEWGYDECYLYVEERNRSAIQLYRKLGYRKIWRDDTARTLLPTSDGALEAASTVIVCMKKNLNDNFIQRLFR